MGSFSRVLLLLWACVLASYVSAQVYPYKILVIGANSVNSYSDDIAAKLAPYFTTVTSSSYSSYINSVPFSTLSTYDGIFVYSNFGWVDAVAIGDTLANFVDSGKPVIKGVFGLDDLKGKWGNNLAKYSVFSTTTSGGVNVASMPAFNPANAAIPNHPILNGVSSFKLGNYYYSLTGVYANSTVIAYWPGLPTIPLIAVRDVGTTKRVDINWFMVSNSNGGDQNSWQYVSGVPGADKLLANAFVWAIRESMNCSKYTSCDSCANAGCSYCAFTGTCSTLYSGTCPSSISVITNATKCFTNCNRGATSFPYPAGCVCESGYTGSDCSVAPTGCTAQRSNLTFTALHPTLDKTSAAYANNSLILNVTGPLTSSRAYTNVTFEGATNEKCTLGSLSSFWTQKFSGCQDVFSLQMPWANRSLCGFAVSTQDENTIGFKSRVTISFKESIGNLTTTGAVYRTANSVFDLYVSFPRTVTVTLVNMTVSATMPLNAALTQEKYDAASGALTLELTTSVGYSYMLRASTVSVTIPSGIVLNGAVSVDGTACTTLPASACLQKTVFSVKLASGNNNTCTFDGTYTLRAQMANCRENNGTGCDSTEVAIQFVLTSGSVCASVGLEPSVTGSLRTYKSSEFNLQPTSLFGIGDQVYFYVDLNAGLGNTPTVTFVDIQIQANSVGNTTRYLLKDKQVQADGNSTTLKTVTATNNYFSLFLTGNVFSGSIASYTFAAKMEVNFGGNKRSLDVRGDVVQASTRIHIFSSDTVCNKNSLNNNINPHATLNREKSGKIDVNYHNTKVSEAGHAGFVKGALVSGVVCAFVTILAVSVVVALNKKNAQN